jgi:hypothetical protein
MPFLRLIAPVVIAAFAWAQAPSPPNNSHAPKPNPEAEKERSRYDPLLDLPALPQAKLTLIGGTVGKVDPIADRLQLVDFGGGTTNIAFDLRTKIFRNGRPATVKDLEVGHRVYVDTMLVGDRVFAKTIRVETGADQGDARGQVVAIDAGRGTLELREEVAPQHFRLRLTPQTTVMVGGRRAKASEVLPRALVVISFAPSATGSVVREIRVLANPGQTFSFAGKVTFLDLRLKRLAIANQTDHETYDIALDRVGRSQIRSLRVGSDTVVKAVFDGKAYQAQNIEISAPRPEARE